MSAPRIAAAAVATLIAGLFPTTSTGAPAAVGETRAAWSTYLRAGPGARYAVTDEIEHDTPLTVMACGHRWCRVRVGVATGYVDQEALTMARPTVSAPERGAGCTVSGQVDYHGQVATRFCPGRPAG